MLRPSSVQSKTEPTVFVCQSFLRDVATRSFPFTVGSLPAQHTCTIAQLHLFCFYLFKEHISYLAYSHNLAHYKLSVNANFEQTQNF